MDDIAHNLVTGHIDDAELLAAARQAVGDPKSLARWREGWPTEHLPVIDDYCCTARLGQGATGVVYKAVHLRDEPRFVAIKLLQLGSQEAEARFREREVEILRQLACPHVARLFDSGIAGGRPYLVTELVEGTPLDEFLSENPLTLEGKLAVFQQVCEAVGNLHDAGVMHRDLKPKHVIVDPSGTPWIVDFGLSAARGEDWSTRVRHTRTELGHILGTVRYMSPEQAWGGLIEVDHRADIWALGVMLYEIATGGDYPYDLGPIGDLAGQEALLHRIQSEVPKRPKVASPQLAGPLTTLISRCLAHDPRHRVESAALLADDIDRCLASRTIRTRGFSLPYRVKRIAVGLTLHGRVGLWTSTVACVLAFLFAVSLVFGVRWKASGDDYGRDTRRALANMAWSNDGDIVTLVGISNRSLEVVPPLAAASDMASVTRNIKTWRGLHGHLMERLASAKPAAVLWDFYFQTPGPLDAQFAKGVRALADADVPVVLAVRDFDDDGQAGLSPDLYEPISDIVRYGIILARDMVAREGETVLARTRGDTVHPSLILSTFAALVHPDQTMAIEWPDRAAPVRVVYHPRPGIGRLVSMDQIGLTTPFEVNRQRLGVRVGDVLACKAFELKPPDYWSKRTESYESLLTATDAELAERLGGRIVLFGDMRAAHPIMPHDRHRVRYGTKVIDDVPGAYVLADAIRGMFLNRHLNSETPMTFVTFITVALFSFMACMCPSRFAERSVFSAARMKWGAIVLLLTVAAVSTVVLVFARSAAGVSAAMLSASICLCLAAGFAIEFVRNRYRRATGP